MDKKHDEYEKWLSENHANYPARDILYDFAQAYQKSMNKVHDFGQGINMTSVEAHTLKHICQNDGVTITDIVNYWGRTKGTVSAQITNLEKKGYVYREKCKYDAKKIHIHPTEKGLLVNRLHAEYDANESDAWSEIRGKKYTREDIMKFWEMIVFYTGFLNERNK